MVLPTLRLIALAVAFSPLAYYILSLYAVLDYFRALRRLPPRDDSFAPPVSILKPVRGVDPEAYENFTSYCRLDYPDYEMVFAVADAADPVIPVIEKLQRDYPARSIRLATGVAHLGANNKVNNLCRLVAEAKHDLVVMTDSDVRVDSDYLREVVAPFANPAVGAVTAFYRGIAGGSFAADLDELGMCADSAPSALVARKLEGRMQFAFGWTMATTKKVLSEIGGFEAMVNYHSDDFELGNRISRRGYRVELIRKPVWMVFPKETMSEFLKHELRWSIGLRNVRPAGYIGIVFTHGLPWAVFAAAVAGTAGWTEIAIAYLVAYLVLRFGVAWTTAVWGLGDTAIRKKLWLLPVRDAISFAVWAAGFFTDRITWRGIAYRVKKGLLVPAGSGKEGQA